MRVIAVEDGRIGLYPANGGEIAWLETRPQLQGKDDPKAWSAELPETASPPEG